MDEQLPATCQMDRSRLGKIEEKLDKALDSLEHLVSMDGPIGKLQQEIVINRHVADAAHKRIDKHDQVIDKIGGRQWEIVWKSAGLVGGGGLVGYLAMQFIEKVIR